MPSLILKEVIKCKVIYLLSSFYSHKEIFKIIPSIKLFTLTITLEEQKTRK